MIAGLSELKPFTDELNDIQGEDLNIRFKLQVFSLSLRKGK